jgi:hypothetical protein
MMDEKAAANPYSGLDKALLRSTQPRQAAPVTDAAPSSDPQPAKTTRAPRQRSEAATPPIATPRPAPSDEPGTIEALQRALKTVGKEIFYARVAPDEKRRVDETVFALKQAGVRTSVNEVGRIALNYLMADHEAHGEQSILSRVLASKRA